MRCWKVTKPDGTTFYGSPPLVAAEGVTLRPVERVRRQDRELCAAGLVHASPTPEQAARFGRWPFVLWECEGRPVLRGEEKAGFVSLRVVGQADVGLCFGPNGGDVVRLLDRAARLTADEVKLLDAAWDAARRAARVAAWGAAWDAAWGAARDVAWDVAWDAARRAARDAARDAAGNAAGVAAWALVVRDLITPEQFDALTAPWVQVVGASWEEQ